MSEDILQVKGLGCSYRSNRVGSGGSTVEVLKDINLNVRKGEIFGLVGESGCGKSTLARAIMGLTPSKGEIMIDGSPVEKKRTTEQRKLAQIVFQDPFASLNPSMHIGRILEEPLRIHRIGGKKERAERVQQAIERVGLGPELLGRFPRELSGGQRQRVSIAAALMLEPKLLIADEATSALDVSVQAQILNLLQSLHESMGLSILFISHNLNVVYYLCDRVAVMSSGSIVELAPVKELFDHPLHPYTKALLASEQGGGSGEMGELSEDEPCVTKDVTSGCTYDDFCNKEGKSKECKLALPDLVPCGSADHLVRCHAERTDTNF